MTLPVSPSTIILGGGIIAVLSVVQAAWKYQQTKAQCGNTPGYKLVVANSRQVIAVIPVFRIPFTKNWIFNIGASWWTGHKHEEFRTYGQDILSAIAVDGSPPCFLLADAEAIQEVTGNRLRFPKPIEVYRLLNFYGRNVVTTEGEDWRIHRKITTPSFSENSNRLVCEETVSAMQGLFEIWKGKDSAVCGDFTEITVQIALIVICGAGFGMHVPWSEQAVPAGHEMSFKEAVELASSGLQIKAAIPSFALKLTKRTARVAAAFVELKKYILEMVRDRATSYQDYSDLFSNLLEANANDSESLKLTDEELTGNIFIFLIAGHETTAHTLAFAAALLSLYPDIQEKLYEHVKETVADPSGAPTYSELSKLSYALAVFNETLRLCPSVVMFPKISAEDTTLRTVNTKGKSVVVPIPKGSFIHIIVSALHDNPRYWPEPEEFKPERFLGDWPRHAFAPFSLGARSCMGKRFAEIEGVVALSMLVRNYRIAITEEHQYAHETFEQRKARIFSSYNVITMTPDRIPVTLTRRR